MYSLTLNELGAVMDVSAQATQNGAVNKLSAESAAQDNDSQYTTKHERDICNGKLENRQEVD
jgi:hypothetical protein